MILDTDLLRMGADYSNSAASIVRRGASQFSEAQARSGIFGDFDAANSFQATLSAAQKSHVEAMTLHSTELDALAVKANVAATTFVTGDETAAEALTTAGDTLD
ncbi:DUF2563 family protein [Mycobacterium sp. NPDC003323]